MVASGGVRRWAATYAPSRRMYDRAWTVARARSAAVYFAFEVLTVVVGRCEGGTLLCRMVRAGEADFFTRVLVAERGRLVDGRALEEL